MAVPEHLDTENTPSTTPNPTFRPIQTQVSTIASIPPTPNTFLLHSTNCLGTWGAGFARAVAETFPAAEEIYKSFCTGSKASPSDPWPPRRLAGQCLIIPPQKGDEARHGGNVFIVCLFTSYGHGGGTKNRPGKDSEAVILEQTRAALRDFREQLLDLPGLSFVEEKDLIVWSPLINSGAFGVAWEETQALIVEEFEGWAGTWKLMTPPR